MGGGDGAAPSSDFGGHVIHYAEKRQVTCKTKHQRERPFLPSCGKNTFSSISAIYYD